jgi:hypothetical protein
MQIITSNSKMSFREVNKEMLDYIQNLSVQIKKDFLKVTTNDFIFSALKKKSFSEFLFKVFFGNCIPENFNAPKNYEYFPQNNDISVSKDSAIKQIASVLKSQRPIIIDSLCITVKKDNPQICQVVHSTVISGYKKVCKSATDCKELFRIHNCDGKEWQDKTGGWYDAEILLNNQINTTTDKIIEVSNEKQIIMMKRNKNSKIEQKSLTWLVY